MLMPLRCRFRTAISTDSDGKPCAPKRHMRENIAGRAGALDGPCDADSRVRSRRCGHWRGKASPPEIGTARVPSPARASASASAILISPSTIRTFLIAQQFDAKAHLPQPSPGALLPSPRPREKSPNARHIRRSCLRAIWASSTAFSAACERSPRISSNKAACKFPFARVTIGDRSEIRVWAPRTRETARPTSPIVTRAVAFLKPGRAVGKVVLAGF